MSNGPLIDRVVCLSELSKDLEGELRPVEAERERCADRDCVTLETVHQLDLRVTGHDCDSDAGALLDGKLHCGQLVHKYAGGDGTRRGLHEGPFRWRSATVVAAGTLQGVTSVGTHRRPPFDDCQRCDDRGVMEGMLLGRIARARDRRLIGCELRAAYRIRFDPSKDLGGSGAVAGTLEGAIVCDCGGRPPRTCIDFSAMPPGSGSNPRNEMGVSFAVQDPPGTVPPNTSIVTFGSFTGLNVGRICEIKLPVTCASVEATLVTLAQAADFEAFNSDGTLAGTASMTGAQNAPETLTLTGASIDRAVITARADETLLLRFCFEPTPR